MEGYYRKEFIMGFGKSIKKHVSHACKKVTNPVKKSAKKVANATGISKYATGAMSIFSGFLGGNALTGTSSINQTAAYGTNKTNSNKFIKKFAAIYKKALKQQIKQEQAAYKKMIEYMSKNCSSTKNNYNNLA